MSAVLGLALRECCQPTRGVPLERGEPVANASPWPVREHVPRDLSWLDLAEGRLRLDRLAATASGNFLPLPAAPPFLARQESRLPPSSAALRLSKLSASSIASGLTIAIEAAMDADPVDRQETSPWRPSAPSPSRATPHGLGQDPQHQRQGHDQGGRQGQRQGPRLPRLRRLDRVRGGLEEDLQRRPLLLLGQARRPELPGSDLRHPGRERGRGQLQPNLVPPQRRLTDPPCPAPLHPERGFGALKVREPQRRVTQDSAKGNNSIEFGAAWTKCTKDGARAYHSVKLDDPSFPAPIYAGLVEGAEPNTYNLVWSR